MANDSEADVETLRREMGEKAAHDGEGLHENASESFRQGFNRVYNGWGSNVTPPKFGRGGSVPKDWDCVCGHTNNGRVRIKVAGETVCGLCGVERRYSEDRG